MFNYRGSTALITGASKGLGAAFAEALAERGMNLVLVARSTNELNTLSARLYAKYKVSALFSALIRLIRAVLKESRKRLNVAVFRWTFSSIMQDSV
jgi:NADP-dependent 3-hydroxy acid dehydrogenase YdfG